MSLLPFPPHKFVLLTVRSLKARHESGAHAHDDCAQLGDNRAACSTVEDVRYRKYGNTVHQLFVMKQIGRTELSASGSECPNEKKLIYFDTSLTHTYDIFSGNHM